MESLTQAFIGVLYLWRLGWHIKHAPYWKRHAGRTTRNLEETCYIDYRKH
jgi:hypothetical protein